MILIKAPHQPHADKLDFPASKETCSYWGLFHKLCHTASVVSVDGVDSDLVSVPYVLT